MRLVASSAIRMSWLRARAGVFSSPPLVMVMTRLSASPIRTSNLFTSVLFTVYVTTGLPEAVDTSTHGGAEAGLSPRCPTPFLSGTAASTAQVSGLIVTDVGKLCSMTLTLPVTPAFVTPAGPIHPSGDTSSMTVMSKPFGSHCADGTAARTAASSVALSWPALTCACSRVTDSIEASFGSDPIDVAAHARIIRTDGVTTTYEAFDGELKPGEMAAVFLTELPSGGSASVRCPDGVVAAVRKETSMHGTLRAPTFQITATAPVSAYTVYPIGVSTGSAATLLLPLASWKNDYIVTNVWGTRRTSTASQYPSTHILAAQNDTEITLVPNVHLFGGPNVDPAEKGKATTYRLSRGEQIQLSQEDELTGTRIAADKPIAVSVGHELLDVPSNVCCGEQSQTALFPLKTWGNEYALAPYRSRRTKEVPEDYLYRITGAVDGTALTYEPARPNDAPATIAAGESVVFTTQEPFVVKSQDSAHAFAIHSYMTGANFAVPGGDEGDPELMTVIPTEQYLGRYVFWVDPTFASSHLVVVRVREEGRDFKPVILDCAGPLDDWKPLGTSGKYEYTRPWLKKAGKPQALGAGTCTGGRREITSDGPVGVSVWGTDYFGSYGYPGGAGLRALNTLDVQVK